MTGAQVTRLPRKINAGAKLKRQLADAGHALIRISRDRIHCTRCRQSVQSRERANWVEDGRCRPLNAGRPASEKGVRWGTQILHTSHSLRWDGSRERWYCFQCNAGTSKRAILLARPCRRRVNHAPSEQQVAPLVSGGSARWDHFKQRILNRVRQST